MSTERQAAVAATLRQVAEWGLTWNDGKDARDELREIADQVEHGDLGDCCPMCQEIECDHDCSLAPIRNSEEPS